MPFEIIRGDITATKADAIVNTANPNPVIGSGVDAGIHKKAGSKLLTARKKIGPIPVGQAAVTRAYNLDAKFIIHAVGPVWQDGKHGEEALLRRCYDNALALAAKKHCESVAFPLLSAGNDGFPKAAALQIAVSAFSAFLMDHEMHIILVVFDRDAFALSEKLFRSVRSYIDEHYIRQKLREEYAVTDGDDIRRAIRRERLSRTGALPPLPTPLRPPPQENDDEPIRDAAPSTSPQKAPPEFAKTAPIMPQEYAAVSSRFEDRDASPVAAPMSAAPAGLEDLLRQTDAGFSETLLKLIDRTGKTDAEIYKRANIDRKLFSKIRGNPAYQPSKTTALAFAIALELDLDETRDFIRRAGYALSHSSKFDIIVEYFILQKNYNVMELNETLFAFDQPLIGA